MCNINFLKKNPVTYDQLLDIIEYKYGITLKIDTLRLTIYTIDNILVVTGVPIEPERIMASQEDIQNYYFELSAWIEDIPGDETGCCEWVDATEVKVNVPKSYSEKKRG